MNKSILIGSIAFLGLAVMPCSVQGQVFESIDFSAAQGYVDGPLEGQPMGEDNVWTTGTAENGTSRFTIEDGKLVVTQNEDDNQWIYLTIPVQQGLFIITWDWQYIGDPESTVDFGVTFSDTVNFNFDGNPDLGFNEMGAMVRMNTDPDLDVRDGDLDGGGTYASLVPYDYRDGSVINMRVEVDAFDFLVDVYAQKEGEDEVMLADDYGFRRITSAETNGVNAITMWSNGDEPGNQVIIDNFVFFGPADVSEWSLY